MKYYVYACLVYSILLLFQFDLPGFIAAVVEFYVFICSHSLYEQCLAESQGNALNITENTVIKYDNNGPSTAPNAPPPPYSSCDDMQGQYPNAYLKQMP